MNRLLCCVLMTLVAQTSLADQAAWYQVEMMMIAYSNPEQLQEEQWSVPDDIPPSAIAPLKSSYGLDGLGYFYKAANLLNNAIISSRLPVTPPLFLLNPAGGIRQNSLAWHAKKLSGQRDMQVVWHETWVEAVQAKPGAAIHPINLVMSGESEVHITGGFGLHVSRYLHLKTDLTIQHIGKIPIDPAPAEQMGNHGSSETQTTGINPGQQTTSTAPLQRYQIGTQRYAHFAQSRRMRSRELHYIDHPLMGILIKLTPIKLPEIALQESAISDASPSIATEQ